MKKLKFFLGFALGFMFFIIPNVNADVVSTDISLQSVQMRGSTYTGNDIRSFKIDSTDLIGIYQTSYSENLLSTYTIFNLNNSFDSSVDKIGFFYYNSLLFYGNSSNVVGTTGNSYNTLEVIPPLVRLNNKSCSVKPIGSTSTTNPSGYDYSSFFWVECDILSNSSPNVINVRYIPKAGSNNMTIGIQPKIFTWSNIDTQKEIKNAIDSTNEKLGDLNDNITNDNVDGVENSFESFEGFISENSTITQLITMPITLYSSILNGLQSSCQPFVLGNLFGTNLTIPCINIGNYLGSTLWSMIDIIISGFAIFSISKKLIKIFNNFSSMKEGDVIDD